MVDQGEQTTSKNRQPTHKMYMMTPSDHMSQLLSYFSGPRTSGAKKEQNHSCKIASL